MEMRLLMAQLISAIFRLEDLQHVLSCSLAQIYKLAAHLFVWRKAKIIDAVTTRNVYVVSPSANLDE